MKYKLASQRVSSGGGVSGGGLRPSLLSSSAVGSIRAPRVNVNAGNVKFTPSPVPKIVPDQTANAMLKFGETWANAALEYREREERMWASQAMVKVNNFLRQEYHGKSDGKGGFIGGYGDSVGKEASTLFQGFNERVDKGVNDILSEYPPGVQQKAALRASAVRNQYLTNASKHRVAQLKVEEANTVYTEAQSLMEDIVANPGNVWAKDVNTGLSKPQMFAMENGNTPQLIDGMMNDFALQTYASVVNKSKTHKEKFEAGTTWLKSVEDQLPLQTKNTLMSKLGVERSAAAVDSKKAEKKALESERNQASAKGGVMLYGIVTGGKAAHGGVREYYNNALALYPDDISKVESLVLGNLKEALSLTAREYGQEVMLAQLSSLNQYMNKEGISLFTSLKSRNDIKDYAIIGIPKELKAIEDAEQTRADKPGLDALKRQYEKYMPGIVEGDKSFASGTEVYKEHPYLQVQPGDSKAIIKEKLTQKNNLITLSVKANKNSVPDVEGALNNLRDLHSQGVMFQDGAEFNKFILDYNIIKPSDKAYVTRLRKDMTTYQGGRLKDYTKGVLNQIALVMRPNLIERVNAARAAGSIIDESIFTDINGATPKELNLRNEILSISNLGNIPPLERIDNIKSLLKDYTNAKGEKTFEKALEIEAQGELSNRYVDYESFRGLNRGAVSERFNLSESHFGFDKPSGLGSFESFVNRPGTVGNRTAMEQNVIDVMLENIPMVGE